jgi:hypothetical protein
MTYRLLVALVFCFTISTASTQTVSNRGIASQQIKDLKTGAIVVRLKTNDRSIEAYRKSGRNELANKLVEVNAKQNQKLVDAFRGFFDYCKVYFIYAKNTNALLQGNQNIFLNDTLAVDTNIKMKEKYFLIAEYGLITTNELTDEYHYKSLNHTEPSSTAASTNVIFISDTSLKQLKEPFPFYQQTYLDNYNKAVDNLSRSLHKAYYKLDDSIKEERKKLKEQLKKLK